MCLDCLIYPCTWKQRAAAAFGFHVANLPRRGRNGFGDTGGASADADGGGGFKAVGGAELKGGRQMRTMLEGGAELKEGGRLEGAKEGGVGRREMLETVFGAPLDAARALFKRAEASSGVGGAGHTVYYSP